MSDDQIDLGDLLFMRVDDDMRRRKELTDSVSDWHISANLFYGAAVEQGATFFEIREDRDEIVFRFDGEGIPLEILCDPFKAKFQDERDDDLGYYHKMGVAGILGPIGLRKMRVESVYPGKRQRVEYIRDEQGTLETKIIDDNMGPEFFNKGKQRNESVVRFRKESLAFSSDMGTMLIDHLRSEGFYSDIPIICNGKDIAKRVNLPDGTFVKEILNGKIRGQISILKENDVRGIDVIRIGRKLGTLGSFGEFTGYKIGGMVDVFGYELDAGANRLIDEKSVAQDILGELKDVLSSVVADASYMEEYPFLRPKLIESLDSCRANSSELYFALRKMPLFFDHRGELTYSYDDLDNVVKGEKKSLLYVSKRFDTVSTPDNLPAVYVPGLPVKFIDSYSYSPELKVLSRMMRLSNDDVFFQKIVDRERWEGQERRDAVLPEAGYHVRRVIDEGRIRGELGILGRTGDERGNQVGDDVLLMREGKPICSVSSKDFSVLPFTGVIDSLDLIPDETYRQVIHGGGYRQVKKILDEVVHNQYLDLVGKYQKNGDEAVLFDLRNAFFGIGRYDVPQEIGDPELFKVFCSLPFFEAKGGRKFSVGEVLDEARNAQSFRESVLYHEGVTYIDEDLDRLVLGINNARLMGYSIDNNRTSFLKAFQWPRLSSYLDVVEFQVRTQEGSLFVDYGSLIKDYRRAKKVVMDKMIKRKVYCMEESFNLDGVNYEIIIGLPFDKDAFSPSSVRFVWMDRMIEGNIDHEIKCSGLDVRVISSELPLDYYRKRVDWVEEEKLIFKPDEDYSRRIGREIDEKIWGFYQEVCKLYVDDRFGAEHMSQARQFIAANLEGYGYISKGGK